MGPIKRFRVQTVNQQMTPVEICFDSMPIPRDVVAIVNASQLEPEYKRIILEIVERWDGSPRQEIYFGGVGIGIISVNDIAIFPGAGGSSGGGGGGGDGPGPAPGPVQGKGEVWGWNMFDPNYQSQKNQAYKQAYGGN